jgi:gliding motility-associated-like protein
MKTKLLLLVSLLITSLTATSQYCIPTYSTVCVSGGTNDLIENFWTTGGSQDISNLNTGCNLQPNNYLNTGQSLIAQPNDVIGLNVQCGATYQQGFAIWVDWNQDFVFDVSEKIYASPNSGFAVFTGSFTIPDVDCGDYRMRVRSKYFSGGAGINPCDNQTYGEVEDYTITVDQCEPTICEGESHTIDMTGGMPPNVTSYSWAPATNISNATGGPIVDVYPTDTTIYVCTITSPDSVWTQSHIINVVHVIEPDAGLDDSLCHSALIGYQLQPTLYNDGDFFWEFESGPATAPGTPNAIFQANNTVLNATTLTNYPGEYTYVFHEADTNDVCPEGTDTLKLFFSKETHTTTSADPSCFGFDDGSIQISSDGSLAAADYSYDGGLTYTNTADSIGFSAGDYTVISRDILGCEFESIVTIIDPLEIILTVGPIPDSIVCENGTATLYASAINGTTYDFHWNQTTDLASVQNISPIGDSTVTVYAESELGCMSDTLPIMISVHDPLSLIITANDSICPGYDSELTVEAIGGFYGYDYAWTENGVVYNDLDNVINMNPTVETQYCVTVSDICETTPKTICSKVIMREVPMPMFTVDTTGGCNPSVIQFSDLTENSYLLAETETAQLNWLIDGTVYNDSLFDHLFENVGDYDVQLEVYTQFGCHNLINVPEYISTHEIPSATFYVISNPSTIFNTEVEMINNTQGDNLTYQWDNTGGLPATSNLDSPTILYPEGIANDYPVRLIVTNEFNCTDTTYDIVHIISDVIIYAPNAFTPDNDALNNDWRVYIDGININEFHLIMFNRWGEIVWESYDPEGVWDGSYGGNPIQDGTFAWSLITKDATSDKKYEFKGQVTIIR